MINYNDREKFIQELGYGIFVEIAGNYDDGYNFIALQGYKIKLNLKERGGIRSFSLLISGPDGYLINHRCIENKEIPKEKFWDLVF